METNSEGFRTSPCKGCGEPMVWSETTRGKRMPLDAEPVQRAHVQRAGEKEPLLFQLIAEQDRQQPGKGPLAVPDRNQPTGYIAHWVTCEKRDDFRKDNDFRKDKR